MEMTGGVEFVGAIASAFGAALAAWVLDRWLGVRERIANWCRSVKARKSMTEAMVASWPTALDFISKAQLRDDAATAREVRITTEMQSIREHLTRQDATLDHIAAQIWGQIKLDPQARFVCDARGRNMQVSSAYAGLLRCSEPELRDYGWKNRIADEDRREYEAAALQAMREHRRFERTVTLVRGDGSRFRGRVRVEPYPESLDDLAEGREALWFGAITLVEDLE